MNRRTLAWYLSAHVSLNRTRYDQLWELFLEDIGAMWFGRGRMRINCKKGKLQAFQVEAQEKRKVAGEVLVWGNGELS